MTFEAMVDESLDGLKRSALTLHALAQSDKDWLLARLPATHREALHRMLDELAQLGVPADPSLVQEILATHQGVTQSAGRPTPIHGDAGTRPDVFIQDALATLSTSQVTRLANELSQEPPVLIAACLQLQSWPWSQVFKQALSARVRQAVEASETGLKLPLPASLQETLRGALERIAATSLAHSEVIPTAQDPEVSTSGQLAARTQRFPRWQVWRKA